MSLNQPPQESLPVDETIQVLEYTTIYKTKKWWKAVVLVSAFGHKKVMEYLWQYKEKKKMDNGKWVGTGQFSWRVQQKMGRNFLNNWEQEKQVIDKYMTQLG
jgi:hypothetical protein